MNNLTDQLGPTDFKFSAKIIYADGKSGLELKPITTEMSYFEDIFGNCCSGQLLVSDSSNYQVDMSLCGDEFLKMMLYLPGDVPPSPTGVQKYFRLYNMGNRSLSKDSNENYILNYSTEEIFISEQYRVCKAYKQMKIKDIVKDIALTYLKIKPADFLDSNIVDTLGLYDIVVPNIKPMEAINWLCTMAVAADTRLKGATFLFYQNRFGWNFKPLLGIYGLYKSMGIPYNTEQDPYQYRIKNDPSGDVAAVGNDDQSKNILSYQLMDNYDAFESTQDGIFANRLVWTDNIKRLHEVTNFDYKNYFDYLKGNIDLYQNKQPYGLMSDAIDRFDNPHNTVYDTVLKVGYKTPNNRVNETIPYRYAQLRLQSAIRLKIAIPGDTSITVGMTIYVDLKAPAPVGKQDTEEVKKMDKFYSGWYLITALRHRTDQEFGFETVLELSKDSFLSAVGVQDSPGLKPFDNGNQYLVTARQQGNW